MEENKIRYTTTCITCGKTFDSNRPLHKCNITDQSARIAELEDWYKEHVKTISDQHMRMVNAEARAEKAEAEVEHMKSVNRYQKGYHDGHEDQRVKAEATIATLLEALQTAQNQLETSHDWAALTTIDAALAMTGKEQK